MMKGKFIYGMGLGMVAGAAVGMMIRPKKKIGKGGLSKAVKSVSSAVEDVVSTLGL